MSELVVTANFRASGQLVVTLQYSISVAYIPCTACFGETAAQIYTSVHSLMPNSVSGAQTEMKKKVDKWQEPAPAKQHKVLPVPDMEPKKRRGGRRFRKMKERYGLTDMRKAANRSAYLHSMCLTAAVDSLDMLVMCAVRSCGYCG